MSARGCAKQPFAPNCRYNGRMRFTEKQHFPAWVQYLFVGMGTIMPLIIGLASRSLFMFLLVATIDIFTFAVIWVLLGMMRTYVSDSELKVVFGAWPVYTKRIPLDQILDARVEEYNPMKEFGGWGIRGMGKNRALNMDGRRGVRLTLRDGSRWMIGSQAPEELAAALGVEASDAYRQAVEELENIPPVVEVPDEPEQNNLG